MSDRSTRTRARAGSALARVTSAPDHVARRQVVPHGGEQRDRASQRIARRIGVGLLVVGRSRIAAGLPRERGPEGPVAPPPLARTGFLQERDYQGLCEAWSKAAPVFQRAVETPVTRAHAPPISQVVGRVVEQFVQWLTEAFHDEGFSPGLAFARRSADGEATGGVGEFRFADHRGCYRVRGQ